MSRAASSRSGIVVVDKPPAMTSHDVVARARRIFGTHAIGHAGTLDPMATGVLVLAIGEATKLVPYLTADDKAYEATLRLGVETTSGDADGQVTRELAVDPSLLAELDRDRVASARLRDALSIERARTLQVPPAVSAIKVDGVAAHARVRRGEALELPAREVAVRSLVALGVRVGETECSVDVSIACAKGYYVRAFARDLARSLSTVGHLTALRRTRSGGFTLAMASRLDALGEAPVVPIAEAACRALPTAVLADDDAIARVKMGQFLDPSSFASPPPAATSAWLDRGGRLWAIGQAHEDGARLRMVRGFFGDDAP